MKRILSITKEQMIEASGGQEQFERMQQMTYCLGIAMAVRNTHSFDADVLAKELHYLKQGVVELSEFKKIVEAFLPGMREEGWFEKDPVPTIETLMMVNDWEVQLHLPVIPVPGDN